MHISSIPLPLNCTVNTASTPIIENSESVFKNNNRYRAKIGLPPLTLSVTTVQFDAVFSSIPSSEQVTVNTTKIGDIEDNETTICQKNEKKSTKRRKIVKKKSKTKFAGVTVESVPTLWLESEIDAVSIVEGMKHSSIYVNCLSKHNRCVVDCHLELLFTNYLWIRFKEKCDSSLSDCMARKKTEIGVRATKYFR